MMDDKFKICGLCSQLVDEPVMLNASLRSFVIDFLGIANAALPAKVCSECYTACYNAKKFSERVDRAREKLRNAGVGDAMILGKGPDDKRIIEAMANLPQMSEGEEVVEDYVAMRLTLRHHPIAFLRHKLTPGRAPKIPLEHGGSPAPEGLTRVKGLVRTDIWGRDGDVDPRRESRRG